METDLTTPLLIEEATASAQRLREAWPWLAEALEPGTVTVVERSPDLRDIERDRLEHRKDRLAAFASTRDGRVPSGPHPSAMRIAPADARRAIATDVRDLADALMHAVDRRVDLVVIDPSTRIIRARCGICVGFGWTLSPVPPPDGASPADGKITCTTCDGRGHVATGNTCWVCRSLAPCHCDLADALVVIGLEVILDALPRLADPDVAAEAQRVLERADRRARTTAGVGEDRRIIKAPCPACGRRGDLYAEVSARKSDGPGKGTSPDPSRWFVRCDYPGCVCRGAGCTCGRAIRWPGRKHVWPSAEWDGPYGLAKRLGVDLPGTEERAADVGPPMAIAA